MENCHSEVPSNKLIGHRVVTLVLDESFTILGVYSLNPDEKVKVTVKVKIKVKVKVKVKVKSEIKSLLNSKMKVIRKCRGATDCSELCGKHRRVHQGG